MKLEAHPTETGYVKLVFVAENREELRDLEKLWHQIDIKHEIAERGALYPRSATSLDMVNMCLEIEIFCKRGDY